VQVKVAIVDPTAHSHRNGAKVEFLQAVRPAVAGAAQPSSVRIIVPPRRFDPKRP